MGTRRRAPPWPTRDRPPFLPFIRGSIMSEDSETGQPRLLVKLRPSAALAAAHTRANLRPLYETPRGGAFAAGAEPQWFVAEPVDAGGNPWDAAHARLADQLGVAESDLLFAEPDIIHPAPEDPNERPPGQLFEIRAACAPIPQDSGRGKPVGPGYAWHLRRDYTQLVSARAAVDFAGTRTRIAHLDTGYYPTHESRPRHLQQALERSFVRGDANPGSAAAPDASGHGTGTLGILAGGAVRGEGPNDLGGVPEAEVLPLRIADSVILLRTSAFAQALQYALDHGCDVVTMSMGGLPSRVWREAVDRAYLAGVCIVAAAGNNVNGFPTRHVVYPARYGRVIAACGAMADGTPYHNLTGVKTLEGNYGPASVMESAIAAYTPNIPWARFDCPRMVRLNGEGTSAATPQVAAAAALWLEKYKHELPRDWRRVEAVRHALFTTAAQVHPREMGRGILRASDALAVGPMLGLEQTPPDRDSFAFLRVLTGLGVAEAPPRERMFNLELAQRWLLNPRLAEIVPDPDAAGRLDEATLRRLMDAVIEDTGASLALRRHVASRYPLVGGGSAPHTPATADAVPEVLPVCDVQPALPDPPYRRLRVYAADPSFSGRLASAQANEVTLQVRWETLEPGPSGEYLKVDDLGPDGKTRYDAVHLDDPRLLAQDGWAPSEGNPQFHQQMVYAVAMKAIAHFEQALGRPVLWRPAEVAGKPFDDSVFVQQLQVRPHALRQANAFYSPREVALLFGYFEATEAAGDIVAGSRVYACLSHDIIAHETAHAVLDGMHRRFNEPTNPDVLALHEGFADIVALMQHFTLPEVLLGEIARTRGDLEAESILGSLAVQFGYAAGGRGALRDAIGSVVDGRWQRFEPDPAELGRRLTPHGRGAILVAAVFDAFLAIYRARTADLLRISTGGTGVLPTGAIHPDLVRRLADEAAKSARHVLTMCIRALDYLPPVDVTFFEYLRALITADTDLVADDRHSYRVAFVEAFRRRGIYPVDFANPRRDTPRTLSVDTLRWGGLDLSRFAAEVQDRIREQYESVIAELKQYADSCFYVKDRETLFISTRNRRISLRDRLATAFEAVPEFAAELGLDPERKFEVHELRRSMRVGPDGRHLPQVVVVLTQSTVVEEDPREGTPDYFFRGGSTLVVDLATAEVKYRIIKRIDSETRQERAAAFVRAAAADPLRAIFFSSAAREPFAALHSLADAGAS